MSAPSFYLSVDAVNNEITFSGRLSKHDVADLQLNGLDRAVVNQQAVHPEDYLLALEIIFRRYREQNGSQP